MFFRRRGTHAPVAPPRLRREHRTIEAMIGIHCADRHGGTRDLCASCDELSEYAAKRLERCPYGAGKPTCVSCPIHCYAPRMRERVRDVMRYAGPRMLLRHPILAIRHILDGKRPAPAPPQRTPATPAAS